MSSNELTPHHVKLFSKRVLEYLCPHTPIKIELITAKVAAWSIYQAEDMIISSASIGFFESIWKSTFPGYASIKKFQDIVDFLEDAAKTAIRSYADGNIKQMAFNVKQAYTRSRIETYFNGTVTDTGEFDIPYTLGTRVQEVIRGIKEKF